MVVLVSSSSNRGISISRPFLDGLGLSRAQLCLVLSWSQILFQDQSRLAAEMSLMPESHWTLSMLNLF